MTPAAFLLLVVPAAAALFGLSVVIGRPLTLARLVLVLSAALTFSILLPYQSIAWWASALLALGLAVQLARLAARAVTDRWLSVLSTIAMVIAAVAVVAGISVRVSRAWSHSSDVSRSEARSGSPNVLLIVMDTVRSASVSLNGYDYPTTPELIRFAAESTVFDNAISTTSWTLPSHGSLLTGRPADALQAGWLNPVKPAASSPALAEVLDRHGYRTGGFVSNLRYTSYESGLTPGFQHYDDYRLSWPLLFLHSSLARIDVKSDFRVKPSEVGPANVFRPANEIASAFLDWQAGAPDRPFFAFLNLFDAHTPYFAPAPVLQRFAKKSPHARYDAAIAWEDEVIGRTLDELKRRGVLDNTIVIVTSDHGELFGEHGLSGHANSLYLPLLHVPLLIRYPEHVPAGRRIATVASLRNIAATVLDLAGIEAQGIPGLSLALCWKEPQPAAFGDVTATLSKGINVEANHRNASGDMFSRIDGQFHYIRNGDGSEELYDYKEDAAEEHNLVRDPAFHTALEQLRAGSGR